MVSNCIIGIRYDDTAAIGSSEHAMFAIVTEDLHYLGLPRPSKDAIRQYQGYISVSLHCSEKDLARLRILESGSDRWLNDKRAWCKIRRIWLYRCRLPSTSRKRSNSMEDGEIHDIQPPPPKKLKSSSPSFHEDVPMQYGTPPRYEDRPPTPRTPLHSPGMDSYMEARGSSFSPEAYSPPSKSYFLPEVYSPLSMGASLLPLKIAPPLLPIKRLQYLPCLSSSGYPVYKFDCSCANQSQDPNHAYTHLHVMQQDPEDISHKFLPDADHPQYSFDLTQKCWDGYPEEMSLFLVEIPPRQPRPNRSSQCSENGSTGLSVSLSSPGSELSGERSSSERMAKLALEVNLERDTSENLRTRLLEMEMRNEALQKQVDAIRTECHEPFIVPALLDAFLEFKARDIVPGS